MARVLGIIGCGKMAYAILKGILSRSSVDFAGIYVNDIDPERASLFSREF
ncbi:MAG: pyrroline-5-carboxylate reductase, partial [Syntrophomonadaceae bacterium]|nr:pyrroline-5-carboxylate reductase [Syntrophomonadaceae bacterium]